MDAEYTMCVLVRIDVPAFVTLGKTGFRRRRFLHLHLLLTRSTGGATNETTIRTHARTDTRTRALTHTHARMHTRTHAHTHTHPYTLVPIV